ncbi:Cation channel sperm-associated protein 2 [Lamellibrachia satsuma]|nr:Cation channel sperm-associated protein 2 [Lamellibrachia satsuma]
MYGCVSTLTYHMYGCSEDCGNKNIRSTRLTFTHPGNTTETPHTLVEALPADGGRSMDVEQDTLKVETDVLSKGAELFRSKLISSFHLLDTIGEQIDRSDIPKYYTGDTVDSGKAVKLFTTNPHALIRFQVYHNKDTRWATVTDRRENRVKNKNSKYPPLDLWAHWLVKSAWFQNVILVLILSNTVVLGIQAEISDQANSTDTIEMLKLVLDMFDYWTLYVFCLEILLKWIDNFWHFWKNRWNIFDFVVTLMSILPEVINLSAAGMGRPSKVSTSDVSVIAQNMRTFRILRSLKMVSRFQKVRLIVLAVTKAFQEMVFITVLLFVFAYIFAIIGVIFFSAQLYKHRKELEFWDSFSSIPRALITLFQLFTLDHWMCIYKDVTKVHNYWFAALYMTFWILLGSFIFRNLFVGIMVNNFQSIRNDLFEEVAVLKEQERRDRELAKFAEELDRQNQLKQEKKQSASKMPIDKTSNLKEEDGATFASHVAVKAELEMEEWQNIVERNVGNLAKDNTTFCWPRDSLFRYFLMMEALQENLEERLQLLHLACQYSRVGRVASSLHQLCRPGCLHSCISCVGQGGFICASAV